MPLCYTKIGAFTSVPSPAAPSISAFPRERVERERRHLSTHHLGWFQGGPSKRCFSLRTVRLHSNTFVAAKNFFPWKSPILQPGPSLLHLPLTPGRNTVTVQGPVKARCNSSDFPCQLPGSKGGLLSFTTHSWVTEKLLLMLDWCWSKSRVIFLVLVGLYHKDAEQKESC